MSAKDRVAFCRDNSVEHILDFIRRELKSLDPNLQLTSTFSLDVWYADNTTSVSVVFDRLDSRTCHKGTGQCLQETGIENPCKEMQINDTLKQNN